MKYHISTIKFVLLACFLLATHPGYPGSLEAEEIVIDAVVASINGEPITLKDVETRLGNSQQISLKVLRTDGDARFVLDQLIQEELVRAEARTRQIQVSSSEVDRYISEVMSRNNFSEEDFSEALARENRTVDQYRNQIELDIMQSKLASAIFRGGVAVSDREIESFLSENPSLQRGSSKIKLRQIFIATQDRPENEALELITELHEEVDSGSSFEETARIHSESIDAQDGGLIGTVAEADLSSEIFDAIFSLKPGEHSKIVQSALGYHVFFVEDRLSGEKDIQQDQIIEEARELIKDRKLQERMQAYFATELFENHIVEKKV